MDGMTFVIYTTSEGGLFKVTRASEDEYRAAVTSGEWDETPFDDVVPRGVNIVDLAMIAFLRVEDNYDFVLGRSRDTPIAV